MATSSASPAESALALLDVVRNPEQYQTRLDGLLAAETSAKAAKDAADKSLADLRSMHEDSEQRLSLLQRKIDKSQANLDRQRAEQDRRAQQHTEAVKAFEAQRDQTLTALAERERRAADAEQEANRRAAEITTQATLRSQTHSDREANLQARETAVAAREADVTRRQQALDAYKQARAREINAI